MLDNRFAIVYLPIKRRSEVLLTEDWGQVPGTYSIDITSPSGEHIPLISARLGEHREVKLLFEETTLLIDYIITASQTGDQLICMSFNQPAPGI